MSNGLDGLLDRHGDRVHQVTNVLVESPYFYKSDNENLFYFLRRHQKEIAQFFAKYFNWELYVDGKCARVYKDRWYNEAINPSRRDLFNFTRRDECIAFMLLLEFFEQQIDIQGVTVDEKENLRFRYGDLLEHVHVRIHELFEDADKAKRYTEDYVRARVLGAVMDRLERYRFLLRIPPPRDSEVTREDTIYECLPALYHYNAVRLSKGVFESMDEGGEGLLPLEERDDVDVTPEPVAIEDDVVLPGAEEDYE